ncbi:hypothetical protein AMATHDRAFT_11463 [Amanita thiersii Skay4041]|uniref:Uncharacterized protein n=1 Tax=Amanita thiersii Skay4041 TaxID=703135 RepID=A0A2A9NA00_9AGAR|nr:hypothetical protein AMATHDRAFT_11463 [Amanita thiersii Skay4041]
MSNKGYSVSPSLVGLNNNAFSTAISSLRSTYQQELASDNALHYIDSVLHSRTNSPLQPPHFEHEDCSQHMETPPVTIPGPWSHSVTPKVSPVVSPQISYRPCSTDNNGNGNGAISCMRLAAFDESQNIAQLTPSHPLPAFLSSDFTSSAQGSTPKRS